MSKKHATKGDEDYRLQQLKIDEMLDDSDFMRGYGNNNTNLNTDNDFQTGDAFESTQRREYEFYGSGNDEEEYDEDEDDEEEEDGGGHGIKMSAGLDDAAPAMPHEFYSCVDNFLKKPPPAIGVDHSSGGPGPSAASTKRSGSKSSKSSQPSLPKINNKSVGQNILLPPSAPVPPIKLNVSSKVNTGNSKAKKRSDSAPRRAKPLDQNLLNEAFAFADQVLRQAVLDDEEQSAGGLHTKVSGGGGSSTGSSKSGRVKPHSAPAHTEFAAYHTQQRSAQPVVSQQKAEKLASSKGMVKKLRMKANQQHQHQHASSKKPSGGGIGGGSGGFDTTVAQEQLNSKAAATDFEQLVSNFQNGTTLLKLQQELQQSKQSISASEQFMRQLQREYSRKPPAGR